MEVLKDTTHIFSILKTNIIKRVFFLKTNLYYSTKIQIFSSFLYNAKSQKTNVKKNL